MARDFNGTSDRIDWASVANLNGSAFTISAWAYLDAVAHSSYVLCQHNSGDTLYGIILTVSGDTSVTVIRRGASDYNWTALSLDVDFDTPSAWHHILTTSDGGFTTGSVAIYVDGVSKVITSTVSGGTETDHTGKWSVGGRIYDNNRNLDGKIAEVAVWDTTLPTGTISELAGGKTPEFFPTDLIFYWSGKEDSLLANPPNSVGIATGTSYSADHPLINSPSVSASISPSASVSPSVSASAAESASVSPSVRIVRSCCRPF